MTAGEGCTALSSRSAECSLAPSPEYNIGQIRIYSRGEDDHVVARGIALEPRGVEIHGGSGNDELSASGMYFELSGQLGDDVLAGGTGGQVLVGGAGRDRLLGGRDGDSLVNGHEPQKTRDLFSGGSGSDTISYSGTNADVRVDLRNRVGGRPGERDRLRSIEGATGGGGDDDLLGTQRANLLVGELGHDRLIGRGGDDSLAGEVTAGGSGDDHLQGPPRTADCGPGRDRVQAWMSDGSFGTDASPELSQPTPRTCEWMVGTGADAFLRVPLVNGRPRVRLHNPWLLTSRLTVALYRWPLTGPWYERGAIVARHRAALGPGERRTVRLELTRAGRRYFATGARRVALVVSESREDTGIVLRLR